MSIVQRPKNGIANMLDNTLYQSQFTLIYTERPANSDALVCLNGPSVHASSNDAYRELWRYVQKRILDVCKEEFVESAERFGISLLDSALADNEELDVEAFARLLAVFEVKYIELIIDWYFELMKDDCNEAFYKIDEHAVDTVMLVSDLPMNASVPSLQINTNLHPDGHQENATMTCLGGGFCASVAVNLNPTYFKENDACVENELKAMLSLLSLHDGVASINVEIGNEQSTG